MPNKGLYTRGPYSWPYRYEQNMVRAEKDRAGRYPKLPEKLRKDEIWFDPIALCGKLQDLRSKFQPPPPSDRIYLRR